MANKIQADILAEIDKLPEFNQKIIKQIIQQLGDNKKIRDIRNDITNEIIEFIAEGDNK